MQYCQTCETSYRDYPNHLNTLLHRNKTEELVEPGVHKLQSAFKSRISTYKITPNNNYVELDRFLKDTLPRARNLVNQLEQRTVKINLEIMGLYYLQTADQYETKSFTTPNVIIADKVADLEEGFAELSDTLDKRTKQFSEINSG